MWNYWSNNSYDCASDGTLMSRYKLTFLISQTLVLTSSVVLNVITICVICHSRPLHTITNVFIASLAFGELIYAIVFDVDAFTDLTACDTDHSLLSRCLYLIFTSFATAYNLLHHLLISAERWLYIARPFLHQRIVSFKLTACAIVFIWITAFFVNFNIIIGGCVTFENLVSARLQFCEVLTSLHIILSFTMIVIYSHIGLISRRQIRNIKKNIVQEHVSNTNENQQLINNIKSTWKQVRMLAIVFGMYFSVVTPYIIGSIYVFAHNTSFDFYDGNAGYIIRLISNLQSCTGFCVYVLQDRDFKIVFKNYFVKLKIGCCFSRRIHPRNSVSIAGKTKPIENLAVVQKSVRTIDSW